MKLFFLYLRTGGGHLAPAKAISSYIENKYSGSHETVLVDGLEGASSFARYFLEDGYRILQSRAKWYFEFVYALNKIIPVARLNTWLASLFIKPILKKRILAERPNKIIVLHFLLIKPTYAVLKECGLDIPVITIVTDPYTAHPMWFLIKHQRFVVFSERLKQHCLKLGFPENRIQVFPFILAEKFSSPLSTPEVVETKRRLGFSVEQKLVLVLGGGDGIPRGEAILSHLLPAVTNAEIAIVCGKNQSLKHAAEHFRQNGNPHLKVLGYVDYIYDLINCADVVVTKCGASTFMEILMLKKIPVVTDFIWEQEKGNVEFIEDNQLGFYEHNLNKLPLLVNRLLTDERFYQQYTTNIANAGLRNGTAEVAEWIAQRS